MPQPWQQVHDALSALDERIQGDPANITRFKTNADAISAYATALEEDDRAAHIASAQTIADENQLLFHNLSYAVALTARHWLTARERVLSLVPATGASSLKKMAVSALATGLGAAAALATGGLAAPAFLAAAVAMAATFGGDKLLKSGVRSGITQLAAPFLQGQKASDSMTDPFEFFLDCEVALRRLAALQSAQSATVNQCTFTLGGKETTVGALRNDAFWRFLFGLPTKGFQKPSPDDIEVKWQIASDLIETHMRRLAWRSYCRSLWQGKFEIELDVSFRELSPPNHWLDPKGNGDEWYPSSWKREPPATWPYKVWKGKLTSLLAVIAADFQGPEHFPEHKSNHPDFVGQDLRDRAKLMRDRMSWISLAMMQCCKVKTDKGVVDLEGNISLSGSKGNAVLPPEKNPYRKEAYAKDVPALLLSTPTNDKGATVPEKEIKQILKLYSFEGVPNVRITSARISDKVCFFGPTGKKGTTTSGYSGDFKRPISESDVMMMTVPQEGTITFTITASGKTDRLQFAKLQIRRCRVQGSTFYIETTESKAAILKNENNNNNNNNNNNAESLSDLVTSFVFGSTQQITLFVNQMEEGIYAANLKIDASTGSLKSENPIYFDEDEWFFRVTPTSDLSDPLRALRWTLAWIYGRTLELLKQRKFTNEQTAMERCKEIELAHASADLPEIDRHDFFVFVPGNLMKTIRLMVSLLHFLGDTKNVKPFGMVESSPELPSKDVPLKNGPLKDGPLKNDPSKLPSSEAGAFVDAAASGAVYQCLANILTALDDKDGKQNQFDPLNKELMTLFRVIPEDKYKSVPSSTKSQVLPDSETLPKQVDYYQRLR